MCGGELADPVNIEILAALRLDRRPRPHAVVSPYCCGREVPMRLLLELKHFDFNDLTGLTRGTDYGRDGEGVDIAG
jgi:hypothetical protein